MLLSEGSREGWLQKAIPVLWFYNPSAARGSEGTGVLVFSATYAEPNGVLGAYSALTFPDFFPKFSAGFCSMAVEELLKVSECWF
jgi:hypothetical protein